MLKRLDYFHATFLLNGNLTTNVVDKNGHPYISQRIFLETGYKSCVVLGWQEITKEEYDYFWETFDGKCNQFVVTTPN